MRHLQPLAVALAIVLPASLAPAQTPPPNPSGLLVLSIIDVKPDMMSEFGELQAQTMNAQRKGGQAWRETWNSAQFGFPYRVGVLRPLTSFAELDGQSFTIKGAGAEQARVINERARRMIVAQRILALRVRPDLGLGSRPATPDLAVVTTVTVAQGRVPEYEAAVKNDVLPALRKAGVPYFAVSQVLYGGDPNQFLTLQLVDGFAGLDRQPPMQRAMGAEGFARYQQKLVGVVVHVEREVVRFNSALSFRPGQPPTAGRP
jgi:hypothetical protein